RKTTETAPEADEIISNGEKTIVEAAKSVTSTFSLTADANYSWKFYAVVVDQAGNISPVAVIKPTQGAGSTSAKISVMGHSYSSMQGKDKIVDYTNEPKEITIEASVKNGSVKSIQYFISDKFMTSATDIEKAAGVTTTTKTTTGASGNSTETTTTAGNWSTYDSGSKPYLKKNQLNYIYAKVTQNDTAGTVTYLSSEAIWEDETKPVASSVTSTPKDTTAEAKVKGTDKHSGIKYYYLLAKPASEASVTDPKSVKSGGMRSEDGNFTLTGLTADTDYKLYAVIEDKCENLSEVKAVKMKTKKASSTASSAAKNGAAGGSGSGSDSGSGKSGSGSGSTVDKRKAAAAAAAGGAATDDSLSPETIRNGVPYISDASEGITIGKANTSGWDKIETETVVASDASWIEVDMNGSTVVPQNILSDISQRDMTYYLKMDDKVTWVVNGLSFEKEPEKDIDFRARLNTKNIPAQLVNEIADVYPHTNVTLDHDGEFGFTAILNLNVGKDNAGLYGNMYYYNEDDNSLEFIESSEIDAVGRVSFTLKHASDYTVVTRGDALTSKSAQGLLDSELISNGDSIYNNNSGPQNVSKTGNNLWLLIISIISLAICGLIIFMPEKKSRRRRPASA
nr:hypothetical protein [Lachnospiraceae bacterium]